MGLCRAQLFWMCTYYASFVCITSVNLNNYFDFHVRLSIRPSVRFVGPFVRKFTSIPAEVLQKVTNKSCLVCVKSEKYASWVTLWPQWDRYCRGKAKVRILDFKTTWSEFQKVKSDCYQARQPRENFKPKREFVHLPRVGPKQLCALAHLGCTRAVGTS